MTILYRKGSFLTLSSASRPFSALSTVLMPKCARSPSNATKLKGSSSTIRIFGPVYIYIRLFSEWLISIFVVFSFNLVE